MVLEVVWDQPEWNYLRRFLLCYTDSLSTYTATPVLHHIKSSRLQQPIHEWIQGNFVNLISKLICQALLDHHPTRVQLEDQADDFSGWWAKNQWQHNYAHYGVGEFVSTFATPSLAPWSHRPVQCSQVKWAATKQTGRVMSGGLVNTTNNKLPWLMTGGELSCLCCSWQGLTTMTVFNV